jgi:hypothetical protein
MFEKFKNILLCLLFPSVLVSKKLKTQKYLLFFFGFVKFAAEFSLGDSIGAWYSLHIIRAT